MVVRNLGSLEKVTVRFQHWVADMWNMGDWFNYLTCIVLGHAKGRKLFATVTDISMPKGWRYATVCRRCKTCEPLAPEARDQMIRLQMRGGVL